MQTVIDTSTWASAGLWKIAPADLPWIAEGTRIRIGRGASIGERASIGRGARIGDLASIGRGASISEGASVGEHASIGGGASIGRGASIGEDASIGRGARIGERASIGDLASIGGGARIGEGASIGGGASIGRGASIGEDASIGEGASIGPNSVGAIDLGSVDGYRKCIAQINGVAYIGAGCRWFPLAKALHHWGNHAEDRRLTMCLMQSAVAIAALKGWAHE